MQQPTTIDATKYRQVNFVGGRILQDRELKLLQSIEGNSGANGNYGLTALYDEGALLNVTLQISGSILTPTPTDPARPMLVFLRNQFEVFTAQAVDFSSLLNGQVGSAYVNYVVWRVTADGENATLADPTLIDTATSEKTAEMGMLQVTFGADDSGPLDSVKMFERNTAAISVVQVKKDTQGVMTVSWQAGPSAQALAGSDVAGLVRTTTDSSEVVSTDDARLSDARPPLSASVKTSTVSMPIPDPQNAQVSVTFVNESNTPTTSTAAGVLTDDASGGVNINRMFFADWKMTLSDAFKICVQRIRDIFGVLQGHGTRLSALESNSTSLGGHAGKNLGISASHPAVVDATQVGSADGFLVTVPEPASSKYAYLVQDSAKNVIAGIQHNGDYAIAGNALRFTVNGAPVDLSSVVKIAQALADLLQSGVPDSGDTGTVTSLAGDVSGSPSATLLQTIKGKSTAGLPAANSNVPNTQMVVYNGSANRYELAAVPAPGNGISTLGGDVSGNPATCTVGRLQGNPVAPGTPFDGSVLTWVNNTWAPQPGAAALSSPGVAAILVDNPNGGSQGRMNWNILQIGSRRVAFGVGSLLHGMTVPLPTDDWNAQTVVGTWGQVVMQPSYASFWGGGAIEVGGSVVINSVGNNRVVSVSVWDNTHTYTQSRLNEVINNTWVAINVIAVEDGE